MSEQTNNTIVLTFAEAKRPSFRQMKHGHYVKFGDDNKYPDYLLELYETAAKHGSITSRKATYVAGKGWKTKSGQPDGAADAFIARVNRCDESLAEVTAKISLDLEIFYGAYVQVIWNMAGTGIAEMYHVDYTTIRTNKHNTHFFHRECWDHTRGETKVFPAFNPKSPHGSQIYFLKTYRPKSRAYPLPDYLRSIDYIAAEVEIGKHTHNNSKSGFTGSKSITFIQGEPSDDEKKKVSRDLKAKFTGERGDKILINFVTSPDRKPVVEDLGLSDLTKEDFTAVDNHIQTNIFSGHEITTPVLFGVATPGALGQRNELETGYQIFQNTYVHGKQQFIEGHINKIARAAGVQQQIEIIPTDPVGVDLATAKDFAPKAWLMEQIGIDPAKYPEAAAPGAEAAQMDADTNPLLRNITGRQWQGIQRLLREVGNGKTTDAAARMLLKSSWGLTDEQINVLLGTSAPGDELQLSEELSEDDKAIAVFAEFGVAKEGLVILKSKKVKYCDDADAEIRESSFLAFAADQLTELQISILDLISKDKRITPEVLANTLGEELSTINTALASLNKSGAIKVSGDETTLTKPLSELTGGVKAATKSFRVMYSYEGPQDSRNRPFCARMMELGRIYTRTEIEKISARLGYSVWDRRGGFYHNPSTGETTPYCRHTWMSHIVMTTNK